MRGTRVGGSGLVLWLVLAGACGGGGGGDLTGGWLLTPTIGVEGDRIHLTIAQSGTALSAEATCNAEWPLGAGSWDGTDFSLTFDFGGGEALVLTGGAVGPALAGSFTGPEAAVGTWTLDRTDVVLDCTHACDPVVVTPFVDADFTDLSMIEEISLFRSSAGHDYSDGCESCRSMKHYYAPYLALRVNDTVPVYSPVDGLVVSVTPEGHGASVGLKNKQVRIRPDARPEVTIILFHVDLVAPLAAGAHVTEGSLLAYARLYYDDLLETAHDFDVAVRVHTLYGDRFVSWFDVITDGLFADYAARGAVARSDFVLTKAARDADPLVCMGDAFAGAGVLPAWFALSP